MGDFERLVSMAVHGLVFAVAVAVGFVAVSILLGFTTGGSTITGIPSILDGDTVEIADERIRLEGIDAPELAQLCQDANGRDWSCGIEARNALVRLGGGREWSCRSSSRDRYGRALATCEAGGEVVNAWMVRNGWALAYVRYSRAYESEERTARQMRLGLWRGTFMAPWDWRHR